MRTFDVYSEMLLSVELGQGQLNEKYAGIREKVKVIYLKYSMALLKLNPGTEELKLVSLQCIDRTDHNGHLASCCGMGNSTAMYCTVLHL